MWQRLQPFGYADSEQSLVHDTAVVIREISLQLGVVPAVEAGNRSERAYLRDLTVLFSIAYRVKYGRRSLCSTTIHRIVQDVREYRANGILPYYVMRTWFALKHGQDAIASHLRLGLQPMPPL